MILQPTDPEIAAGQERRHMPFVPDSSEQQDQKLPGLKRRRLSVLARGTDEELLEEVASRLLERLGVATAVLKQKPAEEIDDLHEVKCKLLLCCVRAIVLCNTCLGDKGEGSLRLAVWSPSCLVFLTSLVCMYGWQRALSLAPVIA
jgi:hypothetical protein